MFWGTALNAKQVYAYTLHTFSDFNSFPFLEAIKLCVYQNICKDVNSDACSYFIFILYIILIV